MQLDEQPSLSAVLPSSHCSPCTRIPSPQPEAKQDDLSRLLAEQDQPASCVQLELQPSPAKELPSSHSSSPVTRPSPQTTGHVQSSCLFRAPQAAPPCGWVTIVRETWAKQVVLPVLNKHEAGDPQPDSWQSTGGLVGSCVSTSPDTSEMDSEHSALQPCEGGLFASSRATKQY